MAFSRLGQVLDIEWLLQRDEGRAADEVARHDRQLVAGKRPAHAEQALALWLAGRRAELEQRTLGVRVSELLTAAHAVLFVLACLTGVGTAQALLEGAGARPTNVLEFLLATLMWPLALLLGSALLWLARGRFGRSVLLEDVYLGLLGALARLVRRGAQGSDDLAHEWRRLRRSARRYRDIEVGTLLAAAQWYPLGFHLGAAASLTGSALLSDLAFAWSTTDASLSASAVTAFFRAATAPWCAGLGIGCVSPELVRATQFSRFSGQYAAPEGALLSGAWWPALLGCLLVYGVLPRLVFSLGVAATVARRSARLSERVLELRGRLSLGTEVISSSVLASETGPEPAPPPRERAAPVAGFELVECWVICWRGAIIGASDAQALWRRLGLVEVGRDAAGGSDIEADRALLERSGTAERAVALVVDGWEAPDKATRRFVQALRSRGAPDRPLFVVVLVPRSDAPELRVWRDRLQLLEDPFVSVQPLVSALERAQPEVLG